MITVIIPTYNEAANIARLLDFITEYGQGQVTEIIVTDGGSTDDTISIAEKAGARAVLSPLKGRAAQMNYAASMARTELLYFIHADCLPAKSFATDIPAALRQGYGFGRYCTRFDGGPLILKINALFTRFDLFICYGGDQTLFIRKDLFERLRGFDESMILMEDFDIVVRAKKLARYRIFPESALISARKYSVNSWLMVQRANYRVVQMYKQGASQTEMAKKYKEWLHSSSG